jgi:hypothetical protein
VIARSLFLAGAISSQARLVYDEQTNKRNEIVQRCFVCLMRAASLFCLIAWPGVGGPKLVAARARILCQHESSEFLDPKRALWCEVAGIKVRRGLIGGAI